MHRRKRVNHQEVDALRSQIAAMNNGRGRQHEDAIRAACVGYKLDGRANVVKVPEPFRVRQKTSPTTAYVYFTEKAQPDFVGVLAGGRAIAFEAKYTSTDRIHQDVVTQAQADALEAYQRLGAVAGVCVGIGYESFFVPWEVFSHMKEHFGHKYATAGELAYYRVRFDGAIKFLDYEGGDHRTGGTVESQFQD